MFVGKKMLLGCIKYVGLVGVPQHCGPPLVLRKWVFLRFLPFLFWADIFSWWFMASTSDQLAASHCLLVVEITTTVPCFLCLGGLFNWSNNANDACLEYRLFWYFWNR